MQSPSILVIGATGGIALRIIRNAAQRNPPLSIHAFARTPSKLPQEESQMCESVIQGDARNPADIKHALLKSRADIVIMAVGTGQSTAPSDIREATARALVEVIGKGSEFEHVKVAAISSIGAGGTKINAGMGIGMVYSYILRHVLGDHERQEAVLKELGGERLLLVRPTELTNERRGKKVVEFDGTKRMPSLKIDREDVATWVLGRIESGRVSGEYCITNN